MSILDRLLPTADDLFLLPGLVVGFTIHELAHALVAYALGDRSPENTARLSFNPLKHVAWLGLVFFLFLGFGWAKPVRINLSHSRHPNRDDFLISIAGVTANAVFSIFWFAAIIGIAFAAAFVGGASADRIEAILFSEVAGVWPAPLESVTWTLASVNLILAGFNLLPIPPLDGYRTVASVFRAITRRPPPAQLTEPPEGEPGPVAFPLLRFVAGGALFTLALVLTWSVAAAALTLMAAP